MEGGGMEGEGEAGVRKLCRSEGRDISLWR